jgi:hypothetical protein
MLPAVSFKTVIKRALHNCGISRHRLDKSISAVPLRTPTKFQLRLRRHKAASSDSGDQLLTVAGVSVGVERRCFMEGIDMRF